LPPDSLEIVNTVAPLSTPLRTRDLDTTDGVRLLRPNPDIPYRDGAEERVLEIVRGAKDITSDSTEMLDVAEGWGERYHTHPARANILRSLDISPDARVLEIGAGCGPITRYLGETASLVDSVEPVLARARVGRERTRDLHNVEVFAGNVEDIPREAAYDLVVIVGVLEYVGAGDPDPGPYLAFLREARARLLPGGCLVLAIENKLGVKYLTGTAEDHSGRMFDSIEDYPRGSPARTFSAPALTELVESAGFSARTFGVFPDYKHTRVVLETEGLAATCPGLLEDLPSFPSRFAGTRSLPLASEQRVWAELSRAGLSNHFSNSFLLIGTTDAPSTLWPGDRLARYFSINRRREYVATTDVRVVDRAVQIEREYSPEPGELIAGGMTSWPFREGQSFVRAFTSRDDEGRGRLLKEWQALLEAAAGDRVPLDAIPTNVIVSDEGLHLIDNEFKGEVPLEFVVERGLFWFAYALVRDTPPETWAPARTIGDLFVYLMGLLDLAVDEGSVSRLLDAEADLQLTLTINHTGPDAAEECRANLQAIFERNVWESPLGRRLHHVNDRAEEVKEALVQKLARTQAELAQAQEQVRLQRSRIRSLRRRLDRRRSEAEKATNELQAVQHSRTYRAAAVVSRTARRFVQRR